MLRVEFDEVALRQGPVLELGFETTESARQLCGRRYGADRKDKEERTFGSREDAGMLSRMTIQSLETPNTSDWKLAQQPIPGTSPNAQIRTARAA
jgi:hypothetical protein